MQILTKRKLMDIPIRSPLLMCALIIFFMRGLLGIGKILFLDLDADYKVLVINYSVIYPILFTFLNVCLCLVCVYTLFFFLKKK